MTKQWVTLAGNHESALEDALEAEKNRRFSAHRFTADNARVIEAMDLSLMRGTLTLGPQRLEQLRRLCQLWDVDVCYPEISSHRPWIGPVIVLAKKIIFRILQPLFRESLKRQRQFNFAVIEMILHLASENQEKASR